MTDLPKIVVVPHNESNAKNAELLGIVLNLLIDGPTMAAIVKLIQDRIEALEAGV